MARPGRCVRCQKQTTGAIYGPECATKIESDLAVFSDKVFNETPQDFADSCMSDFASDDGLSLAEYKEQYGDLGQDLGWMIETFQCHGLGWRRSGNEFVVVQLAGF